MSTPRISILCPSRGRLEPLKLAINSALETASHPDSIEFCIWIDNDDSTYDDFLLNNKLKNIQVIRGQRMWLSIMYNCLASIAKGEYLMWIGDDSKFCTNSWDKLLTDEIDKFDNQIGLVYVNDLAKYEQKYATMGMLHRNWITSFGFLLTPTCETMELTVGLQMLLNRLVGVSLWKKFILNICSTGKVSQLLTKHTRREIQLIYGTMYMGYIDS